jgi:hypothetical protein
MGIIRESLCSQFGGLAVSHESLIEHSVGLPGISGSFFALSEDGCWGFWSGMLISRQRWGRSCYS